MVRFWPKVLPTFGGLLWWQSRLGWIDNVFRPCPELRRWNRKQSINRPKESVHYSHLSLSGGSQMSLTDGVLWFAETGLEWLGTPTVIEQFSTEFHNAWIVDDRGPIQSFRKRNNWTLDVFQDPSHHACVGLRYLQHLNVLLTTR